MQNGRVMKLTNYIVILIMAISAISCERHLREPYPVKDVYTSQIKVSFADKEPAVPFDSIAAYKLSGKRYIYNNDGDYVYALPDTVEVPKQVAYVVYPVEGRDSLYRGVFCRDIKDEQIAVAGGFDASAMWYAGLLDDNNVVLQQTCAFLSFNVVQPDAKFVEIVSNGAPLTGMYTFKMNKVITAGKAVPGSLNSVTLTGDFAVGSTYKAVCMPGSFKNFTVTMKNADGYTIWTKDVVAESVVSCSQTAELGDIGNPDVATIEVKVDAGDFDGYTIQSVNAYYGSDLIMIFGGNVEDVLTAGQTTSIKFYGVGAGDYSNEEIWVVVSLEKNGNTVSVPIKLAGLSIEASKTVTVELGALTQNTQIESDDYYVLYRMGQNIQIGDLIVNQTNYPGAELIKASQLTLARLQKGGLIFVDYEEETPSVDVSTTDSYRELSNELIVIGRNKYKQTEIKVRSLRTGADIAFLNVKLTAVKPGLGSTADQMFSKLSSQKTATALRFKDCFVDNSIRLEFIREKATATSGMYSVISIENCVIKLNDSVTNATLYICRNTPETSSISLKNSVVYLGALKNFESQVVRFYDDQFDASMVDLEFTGNTILNVHGNTAILRRPKSIGIWTVSGNLVVTDNTENDPVIETANNRNVFFLKNVGTPSGGNNFLTTINYTGDAKTILLSKMQSLTKAGTDIVEQTVNPFTSLNYATGYFPVDDEVVINGAGASYDTKYYITK